MLTCQIKRRVIFYTTKDGRCLIREFLNSLPGKAAQKIVWMLNILEEFDRLPATYFKKLKDSEEIWECRIQLAPNIYRIFCFFDKESSVVLTHGIIKKNQKTPKNEIEKAENYRREYLQRRIK